MSLFNAIRRQIAGLVHPVATNSQTEPVRDHDRRDRGASAPATPYDALAKAIGDLVLRHDASGAVLSASAGAEALFGLDARELIGRGFFDRVQVGDRPAFLQAIGEALRREGTICVTLRLRIGSQVEAGEHFEEPVFAWAELRIHRFADAAAGADGYKGAAVVSVVRNLTNAKSHEAALEAACAEAENANSWKDRLLANVSHELRTPLNAIIGFSEILSSAELAPRETAKQVEYAGIIHASAEHLLSVVNLILDISKLEAGRFAIIPEAFDVAPVIAACCDMLRLKAEEGGVALVRTPLNSARELIADKRACRQIVINLLSNAVKFTPAGGQVTVRVTLPEEGGLKIAVSDTGIGIAAHDLAKALQPFGQIDSRMTRKYQGTGLGLPLTKAMIEMHGGSLELDSVVGRGTTASLFLPASRLVTAPSA